MTRLDRFVVIFAMFIGVAIVITIISLFVWQSKGAATPSQKPMVGEKSVANAAVFVSEDGGDTWEALVGSGGLDILALQFRASDPEQLYVGTRGRGLWLLGKGTRALTPIEDPKKVLDLKSDIFDIAESSDGRVLYVALFQNSFGRIARIDENGAEEIYKNPLKSYGIFGVSLDGKDPPRIRAASGDGNFIAASDKVGARKWEVLSRTPDGIVKLITHTSRPDTLWAITQKGAFYVSNSGGRLWVEKLPIMIGDRPAGVVRDGVYSSARASVILATDYGLIETTDDGTRWSAFQTPVPPGSKAITAVAAHPYFADVFWMASGNTVYHTDDGGVSWRVSSIPSQKEISVLGVVGTNPKKIYAGTTK